MVFGHALTKSGRLPGVALSWGRSFLQCGVLSEMAKLTNWRGPPAGYLSIAEAATRSGYTIDQLQHLARSGRLLARRVNTKWYIDDRSLDAFIANRESQPKRGRPR